VKFGTILNITSGINAKYHVQNMLLIVYKIDQNSSKFSLADWSRADDWHIDDIRKAFASSDEDLPS